MQTHFIEATNGPQNWGKFMIGRFTREERARPSAVVAGVHGINQPLLAGRGWSAYHILVLDLQTGEGAIFKPRGVASYDLNNKHKIWVCPLFEPFLNWLYEQNLSDLAALPATINLPDAPFEWSGHRREGAEAKL